MKIYKLGPYFYTKDVFLDMIRKREYMIEFSIDFRDEDKKPLEYLSSNGDSHWYYKSSDLADDEIIELAKKESKMFTPDNYPELCKMMGYEPIFEDRLIDTSEIEVIDHIK